MSPADAALLAAAGLVAGVLNTLAGGASALTVPVLVLVGLPGTVANGTNRVGILVQNLVASWRFRAEGVSGFRKAAPVLLPIALGSGVGAIVISQVSDATFNFLFGVVMVLLVVPMLRPPAATPTARTWSAPVTFAVFFGIGLYGGAFQAGVGIALVLALSYAGYSLVQANSIKVVVNAALTAVAVPVFVYNRQVSWLPALILSIGFIGGSLMGVRVAILGGDRVIRPVLVGSVALLAGKMLGLY
jgi:uncharacterized membrane protein YfcA